MPTRLDGSGYAIATLADELLATADAVVEPLTARHAAEVAEVDARAEAYGQRKSGRKEIDDRHKREVRRARTDELRFGLATLAGAYRDLLVEGASPGFNARTCLGAITAIDAAGEALIRNPNETLLLQGLLATLVELSG